MRENSSRRWGEMRSDAELKIEKRSFQDVSMTCGQIIRKAAAESGMTVLCPEELDRKPIDGQMGLFDFLKQAEREG